MKKQNQENGIFSADSLDLSNSVTKKESTFKPVKYILLVLGIVATFFIFKLQVQKESEKVVVVMANQDLNIGDVFTGECAIPVEMSVDEYNSLVSTTDAVGNEMSSVLTAENMTDFETDGGAIGLFVNRSVPKGTYLRVNMLTPTNVSSNKWVEEVKDGYELYMMDFDGADLASSFLLPGSYIRVRTVLSVDPTTTDVNQIRELIAQKELNADNAELNILNDGTSILEEYLSTRSVASNANSSGTQVPIAEIYFDKIRIADMENSQGESIYSIYMALLNMPLDVRKEILSVGLTENASAEQFKARVKPSKLQLILTKEQASTMAEFENLGSMNFKYTLLPSASNEDSLYRQLRNVSSSINSFSEAYEYLQ